MKWTADQIEEFRSKFSDGAIYADRIMRPMAEIFCPDVLRTHDRDWNDSDTPLGPNWHTFASDLERAIIEEHGSGNSKKLIDYYTFLNWCLCEKKSFLHRETIVTPFEGIASELNASLWMKYIPMAILDDLILHMSGYFVSSVSDNMKIERSKLLEDRKSHSAVWRPLHQSFTDAAKTHSIPYTNLL